MSSCAVVDRDAVTAAFDALDAAVEGVLGLDFEALTTRERLTLLERCERVRRRLPAVEHPLIDQLAHQATPEELGGKLSHAVAESGQPTGQRSYESFSSKDFQDPIEEVVIHNTVQPARDWDHSRSHSFS